jgi:hypothetical protein
MGKHLDQHEMPGTSKHGGDFLALFFGFRVKNQLDTHG